jgi:hypothetical protein
MKKARLTEKDRRVLAAAPAVVGMYHPGAEPWRLKIWRIGDEDVSHSVRKLTTLELVRVKEIDADRPLRWGLDYQVKR